jgi:hypothetical protein
MDEADGDEMKSRHDAAREGTREKKGASYFLVMDKWSFGQETVTGPLVSCLPGWK